MKKYIVIYKAVLMETLQYASGMLMDFLIYFMLIFIFIHLWNYIYEDPGQLIAGYTKEQMIWYVMMTETIWFGCRSRTTSRQAAMDIRGGNIAYQLNKPYHYTLYVLAKYTGEWSVRLPAYMLLAAVSGVLMAGPLPGFRPLYAPAAALSMILGVMVHGIFKLCISLISFWIEDSNPFQWLYDKLILVVGTIFPIEIFPAFLQPLFKLTPIYAVCYGPAKLVVDFSPAKFVEIVLAQMLYLAAGCGLMLFIYGKGVKKLHVNGG